MLKKISQGDFSGGEFEAQSVFFDAVGGDESEKRIFAGFAETLE